MRADPAAQAALLLVQEKDSALAQLAHRRRSLPELEQLAAVESRLRELEGRRIEAQTQVSDLGRAQSKADGEVEVVKSRRTRDEERLNSGAITNPKDLAGLQSELTALQRRISTLEDEELEVMEALETAQGELDAIVTEIAAEQAVHDTLAAARDEKLVDIDADASVAAAGRSAVLPDVPADLLALYEKVRANHGGLGAATLQARRCSGCHLEINGADLRELAAEPVEAVLRCPECDRLLIRTPESGL